MTTSASIFEAKTNLSDCSKRKGNAVTITTGRARTPIARLEPMQAAAKKRLGVLETPGFVIADDFFDPLPESELRLWNGDSE